MDFWIKAAQLLLSLSILVVLHEFGHYFAARYFKIRVEKFYLFFNPWFSLFQKKIGETTWGIGWLPLGGYVKISGMVDESMDKEQLAQPPQPWEFRSKPAWQRLIVMVGGVFVNIVVGILIYGLVVFSYGEEQVKTESLTVGLDIHPYLEKYDLRSGDNILELDGEKVMHTQDITKGILLRDQRKLKVQRPNGDIEIITLPEGIDYELFENGALPVAGLRVSGAEIKSLVALKTKNPLLIKEGDVLLKVNGEKISDVDFSSPELLAKDQHTVLVARGKDTLVLPVNGDQVKLIPDVSPALKGGLKVDDKIIAINNKEIHYFDEVRSELYQSKKKNVVITVLRGDDSLNLTVKVTKEGSVGFFPNNNTFVDTAAITTKHYGFFPSLGRGVVIGYATLSDYAGQLKFLFTKKGASSIGGFGAIGSLFPATWNWQIFWLNTALISIILAFMNILPIPALDGGHVVFLLYEIITGKEAPQKVLEYAQYVGFILLMGLLLYANGNDIYRWLFE